MHIMSAGGLSYWANSFTHCIESTQYTVCVLPNIVQIITVEAGCFSCGEIMFKPYIIGREEEGVHDMVSVAIKKCDPFLQRALYGNILLSGGTTMLSGERGFWGCEVQICWPLKR